MSIKVTRKELKENYTCIGCGYCNAQYLLNYTGHTFYTCGVYGWNFDGYILRHSTSGKELLPTTGYRNMIHNSIVKDDYLIIAKYERQAKELFKEYRIPNKQEVQNLIDDLIDEIYEKINKYYYGD